ncbi:hypothetical protein M409DRAFT_68396 [Zasmidium cellare ATCC 36951]|uniref:Cupin 2 conserved barrel domain-containing protein n=1 Tax=Zasmidium cellare ATCC 36951 TaxID=1080233 RepID=A0A6A6CCM3_ZASCE|nr:uncharacterized protein M409DRAFT_68396 [Zasmidium cellare ATCC 36951]KAF2163439.1 hypothetical protein M409DRAFT_68396 [Zasmidium cellare ATCC 36951]
MAPPTGSLPSPFGAPSVNITTHNESGTAILHSSRKARAIEYPTLGGVIHNLYSTDRFPADLTNEVDIARSEEFLAASQTNLVQPHGTVCRLVDLAPHNARMMHQTKSLDYGIVLKGKVFLDLDDGTSTLLEEGDIAVQRATLHSWRNASETEWCRIVFVLQDIQALEVGGKAVGESLGEGEGHFQGSGNP